MASNLFDCTGKVTMVTGGNGGIGLGFAMGCAKMGSDIAIWARNEEKNAAAKEKLLAAGAPRVETYVVDVGDRDAIIAGYAQLMKDFGRIDCVFANSGRSSRGGSVLDMDPEEWHDLLNVSLHGAFFTLQEAAKLMVERAKAGEPGGSLVFCGSLSMFHGVTGIENYAAAKGGMGAAIRGMAAELGKYGIRANSIAPGMIVTEGLKQAPQEVQDKVCGYFASVTPIPRTGTIEDMEGISAYLCSDASSFHTGDTLVVDGGSVIYPPYAASVEGGLG
jgi:NAD(P)-dependent dehydrogenase (short-subunit alcohol dehydrogenase family)